MDFPKKQAQRLMPLYLLEYSEKLFENHPNPEAPWGGGGGGGDYTAGYGIDITNSEISVDTDVIARKIDIPTVNNPTITFTQGGVTKGSITLNQSSNQTIALDAGGTLPDSPFLNVDDPNDQMLFSLDGSSGSYYKYVDLSSSNRLFYVNLSALNPVFKNGLTSTYNTQTNQLEVELNAVIPDKTSDLINDSGFITSNDVPTTATSTSTSTVTPTTIELVFTYEDNTTQTITLMTGATVSTSTTTTLS